MSRAALDWARRQKTGSCGAKAVLMALADHADGTHSCFPGQKLLAEETEQSERSVRTHLVHLETLGLIQRESRARSQGRGRTSDRYYLAVDKSLADPHLPAMVAAKSGTNRRDLPDQPANLAGDMNPPENQQPPSPRAYEPVQSPLVAAVQGGRVDSVEQEDLLRLLAAALPAPLGADLLADRKAAQVARRLAAIADVIDEREVIDVLTAELPAEVTSIAGLLLHGDCRIPRLEERARARRLDAVERAQRRAAEQTEGEVIRAVAQVEAEATARDFAAIEALPPQARTALFMTARSQHPLLRQTSRGDDDPLVRAAALNLYRAQFMTATGT
jgi:helix-turn-helix protein